MHCREIGRLLPLYTDTTCTDTCLTEKELKDLLDHLATCPACAREADAFCRMVDLVKGLAPVRVPQNLCARIMERLADPDALAEPRRLPWLWPALTTGSVAAAACVLVLLLYRPISRTELPLTASFPPVESSMPAPASDAASPVPPPAPKREIAEAPLRSLPKLELKFAPSAPAASALAEEWPVNGLMGGPPRRLALSQRTLAERADYPRTASGMAAAPFATLGDVTVAQWTGDQCALHLPEVVVARTPEEAQTLWDRSGLVPVPETATLNWGRDMLVAVFLGDLPGSGFSVHLLGVRTTAQRLVLQYRVQGPDPGTEATDRSRPYLLAVLGASDLPVVARPVP